MDTDSDGITFQLVKAFFIEAFVYIAASIVITVLRTYARVGKGGWRRLGPDDCLAWAGMLFHVTITCLAYHLLVTTQGLTNSGMTDEQRAALNPDSLEYSLRVMGSKMQLAGWAIGSLQIWSLKASMCCFYLRLTDGLEAFRGRVYGGLVFVALTFLVVNLVLLLSCNPITKNWQINPDPGVVCQSSASPINLWVSVSLNISTDLYLLFIPIPLFFGTTFSFAKKIGLFCLFGCGIFVPVAAILRTVYIFKSGGQNQLCSVSWSLREMFVATVTTNVPLVFPMVSRWVTPLFASVRGRGSTALSDNPRPVNLKTIGRISLRPPRAHGMQGLSGMTFTESEQNIVLSEELKLRTMTPTEVDYAHRSPTPSNLENEDGQRALYGITREVQVHVVTEEAASEGPGVLPYARGNFTTTSGPQGAESTTPMRSSFFADHVHQDGYSKP